MDRDLPYDLEDHPALAHADDLTVDPLRASADCVIPEGCGASEGEIHWPDCPTLLGDDLDEDDQEEIATQGRSSQDNATIAVVALLPGRSDA